MRTHTTAEAVEKDIKRSLWAGRGVIMAAGAASTAWAYRNMVVTAIDGGSEPAFAVVSAGFLEFGLLGSAFMARAALLSGKDARFWMVLMWVLSGASGAFSGAHELGNPAWWMPALTVGLPVAAAALWHGLIVGEHRMNAGADVLEQQRENLVRRYVLAQDRLRDALRIAERHAADGHRIRAWWARGRIRTRRLEIRENRAYAKAARAHQNREHLDARIVAWLERDEANDGYRARRFQLGALPTTLPTVHARTAPEPVHDDTVHAPAEAVQEPVHDEIDDRAHARTTPEHAVHDEIQPGPETVHAPVEAVRTAADETAHAVQQDVHDDDARRAAATVHEDQDTVQADRARESVQVSAAVHGVQHTPGERVHAYVPTVHESAATDTHDPAPVHGTDDDARVHAVQKDVHASGPEPVHADRARVQEPAAPRTRGRAPARDLTEMDMMTIHTMRSQEPPASWTAIGKVFGVHRTTVMRAYERMTGKPAPATPAHGQPIVEPGARPTDLVPATAASDD